MNQVEPDSPAALKRYEALRRRWRTAGLATRIGAAAVALASLGGLAAGTYLAARAIPSTVVVYSGKVALADSPSPSDSPSPTDTPTVAPTEIPTAAPTEVPTAIPTEVPPLALPSPVAIPTKAPVQTLWSMSGAGDYTSAVFMLPAKNAEMRWSYDCGPASSGAFDIRAFVPVGTPQSTGGVEDSRVAASGEGSIYSTAGVFIRILAYASCRWTASVTG